MSGPDEIMTLAEVAEFTKTSTATIRSLIAQGKIRAIEIGSGGSRRHFRIAKRDLMAFLGLSAQLSGGGEATTAPAASTNLRRAGR